MGGCVHEGVGGALRFAVVLPLSTANTPRYLRKHRLVRAGICSVDHVDRKNRIPPAPRPPELSHRLLSRTDSMANTFSLAVDPYFDHARPPPATAPSTGEPNTAGYWECGVLLDLVVASPSYTYHLGHATQRADVSEANERRYSDPQPSLPRLASAGGFHRRGCRSWSRASPRLIPSISATARWRSSCCARSHMRGASSSVREIQPVASRAA